MDERPADPLGRQDVFTFDPATEWIPYQRLAAAIILHAVTDRRDTRRGEAPRERIDDFLFGRNEGARRLRDHWFRQAGLPVPSHEMILAMIRRCGEQRNAEYRVIQRDK